VELEIKRTELQIKKKELLDKGGPWLEIFRSPVVVGAALAAYAAIAGAYFTKQNSERQINLDKLKYESQLVNNVVSNNSREEAEGNLRWLAGIGLLPLTGPRIVQHLDEQRRRQEQGLDDPSSGAPFGAPGRSGLPRPR
jgi:hypothetical protein